MKDLSPQKTNPGWTGLAEGQVLQRMGKGGAHLELTGAVPQDGPLFATIYAGARPLKGWKHIRVGEAKAGQAFARLKSVPTGGPYRLELHVGSKRVATVKIFFVGDVWILAGQSNMEGCGIILGNEATHPLVRAFSMRREWRLASEPMNLVAESPDRCHAEKQCTAEEGEKLRRTAIKGSGVGRPFALEMLRRHKVPQGLICTAHGGTSMDQWNPERKALGGDSLYASMLASVAATGQPVAGVLWYQGESDANMKDARLYTDRMRKLVAASRRDLKQPRLPWAIVQIAKVYPRRQCVDDVRAWNMIQEEQRLLPTRVQGLETVAAIDLPLDDAIHIGAAGWPALAGRLARAMRRLAFGSKTDGEAIRLDKISKPYRIGKNDPVIDVSFKGVSGGLRSVGEPAGFTVVDQEAIDLTPAYKISLLGNKARVQVALANFEGMQLHYGYGTMAACNITDARGEALPVFGPVNLSKPTALLPFLRVWRITDVLTNEGALEDVTPARIDAAGGTVKTSESDFVNEHSQWEGRSGLCYFSSELTAAEAMKLQVLTGYDGPFRLWIDGAPFFHDPNGTNPALADHQARPLALTAGRHTVHVAMDVNDGKAWGFFLRFRRTDVPLAQMRDRSYAKPAYWAGE